MSDWGGPMWIFLKITRHIFCFPGCSWSEKCTAMLQHLLMTIPTVTSIGQKKQCPNALWYTCPVYHYQWHIMFCGPLHQMNANIDFLSWFFWISFSYLRLDLGVLLKKKYCELDSSRMVWKIKCVAYKSIFRPIWPFIWSIWPSFRPIWPSFRPI